MTLLESGVIDVRKGTLRGHWRSDLFEDEIVVTLAAKWPLSGEDVTWFLGYFDKKECKFLKGSATSKVGGAGRLRGWDWNASQIVK